MIPPFVSVDPGAPWQVLPPGIHWATLKEVEIAFATNPRRRMLFEGFRRATNALALAGCKIVYLDGSFTTEKPDPLDFDGCWDPIGVVGKLLDPVLLTFDPDRATQKRKYFGELFPSAALATATDTYLDFLQKEKFTGRPKGIIGIRI